MVQEVDQLVSVRVEIEVRGAEVVERSEMLNRRRRVEKSKEFRWEKREEIVSGGGGAERASVI